MNSLFQVNHFNNPQPYEPIFEQMKSFTIARQENTKDELWLLEHEPVFTQGQAGKPEHILNPGSIPVVQTDRGGQVTYHGPGQLMIYVLWDLNRLNLGVRSLVCLLETAIIDLLARYDITAHRIPKAPGIYVDNQKIASLGLRVKKGASYHGISLNVDMDLTPFQAINPCGFKNLQMTQIRTFVSEITLREVQSDLVEVMQKHYLALK